MKKKMKAQKLGLVLGMNMAVACLVLQGCKANKPVKDLPPPDVTTVDQPAQPPAQQPVVTDIETTTPTPSVPGAVMPQETPPPPMPTTRAVGKLPPPAKPAETKKPAAATTAASAVTGAAPAATTVHTVKKGEFLSGISRKYNVKMSAIVAANPGINPDRIRIGQKLNIPGSVSAPKSDVMLAAAPAPAGVAPAAANTTAPVKVKSAFKPYTGPTNEYVVKGGDSLGKIALASGISIRALKELNGLTKDNIRPGQKLKVPAEKVSAAPAAAAKPAAKNTGAAADAEKKDSAAPAPAAEKKSDTASAPAEDNKPAETTAPAPAADASAPAPDAPKEAAAPAESAPATPAASGNTYTVKEGDDIVSISIAWGISPSQLMNANDLKDNEPLKPGTVLNLPPNARQTVQ